MDIHKVIATDATVALIDQLERKHGPVIFHQSGGCCDGSSPMCFSQSEFKPGKHDYYLGDLGQAPFYISKDQYDYWKHTQLIIDVVKGRGGMFSLENPTGRRFLVRSRVFTNEERQALKAQSDTL